MNFYSTITLSYYFIYAIICEWVEYSFIYLMLSLPTYIFDTHNPIKISNLPFKLVWFNQIKLVLKSFENEYNTETLTGPQLMLLAKNNSYIDFNTLEQFYPELDTLYLQYTVIGEEEQSTIITKVIDIKKRFDIRNTEKCKFGRIAI